MQPTINRLLVIQIFFLINIYVLPKIFLSFCILILYLYVVFFLGFNFHIWNKHFLTSLGLCRSHTLYFFSHHLSLWDSGNYYGSPLPEKAREKKNNPTSNPYFSHNGPNSPSLSQSVSHCCKLAGGVEGDGVRGWVPLVSRASTLSSLRQSWLPLFGCQCRSGGSGVMASSGGRTE